MRPFVLHRMQVVRKEEKENRLQSFIEKQLANSSPKNIQNLDLTVLARACDSPVLKALATLKETLHNLDCQIRIVVIHREPEATAQLMEFLKKVRFKIGSDLRLLDAHEQLTLGQDCVWIGDCMRREPSKRDAYECYSENCPETSAFTRRSFEEIWNFTYQRPTNNCVMVKHYKAYTVQDDLPVVGSSDEESAPLVSTRH